MESRKSFLVSDLRKGNSDPESTDIAGHLKNCGRIGCLMPACYLFQNASFFCLTAFFWEPVCNIEDRVANSVRQTGKMKDDLSLMLMGLQSRPKF